MEKIRGIVRLVLSLLVVAIGVSIVLLTSWIPIYIRSARLSAWLLVMTARTLLIVNRVKVHFTNKDAIQTHSGFIFANHTTYLDILVLLGHFPVRFVAMEELRSWPFIGYAAWSIGCVFVKRDSRESRAEAREELAYMSHTPPIVIYPEGGKGSGDVLRPFRYGAFEIAVQGEVPILPCSITYDPFEKAIWHKGENPLKAFMRLCSYKRPVHTKIDCLPVAIPLANDDPIALSVQTHDRLEQLIHQNKRKRIPV